MQQAGQLLDELSLNLKRNIKDHSIVNKLNQCLKSMKVEDITIDSYSKLMLKIYDLSNSYIFIKEHALASTVNQIASNKSNKPESSRKTMQLDVMSMNMKAIVLHMLINLIIKFQRQQELHIPLNLLSQSFEMMVIISRIFLDEGGEYANLVSSNYAEYQLLVENISQDLQRKVPARIFIMHYLNMMEIMKFIVETNMFKIQEYLALVKNFHDYLQGILKKQQKNNKEIVQKAEHAAYLNQYQEFCQYITLEIIMKLLKKGRNLQQIQQLKKYLSQDKNITIDNLLAGNLEEEIGKSINGQKNNAYYYLYCEMQKNGLTNITDQNLRQLISEEKNFLDKKIFDVAALTEEPYLLEIWFSTLQSYKKSKPDILMLGYKCFCFLVDKQFSSQCLVEITRNNQLNEQFEEKQLKKQRTVDKYLRVCKAMMSYMLSEKKQSNNFQPVENILKKFIKILIYSIIWLYPKHEVIKDFSEKIIIICNKYSLMELYKTVLNLQFYDELLMHAVTPESYTKFIKNNLMNKNLEFYKVLKLAYELQTQNIRQSSQQERQEYYRIYKQQPYIFILFASKISKYIILDLAMLDFIQIPCKFQIYFCLLKQNSHFQTLEKIIEHFWLFLQSFEEENKLNELSMREVHYIKLIINLFLKQYLSKVATQDNAINNELAIKMSMISLWLEYVCAFYERENQKDSKNKNKNAINYQEQRLGEEGTFIMLNNFSKINQILKKIDENLKSQQTTKSERKSSILYLCKIIVTCCHEKYKIMSIHNHNQITLIPGEIIFLRNITNLLITFQPSKESHEFARFMLFEIECLSKSVNEVEVLGCCDLKLLFLLSQSKYISGVIKTKILRKLIRQSYLTSKSQISLECLSEMIQISVVVQEKEIYVEYMISLYGEEGRIYLMLQYELHPDKYSFLCDVDFSHLGHKYEG